MIEAVDVVEEINEIDEQGEDVIEFTYDENLPEIFLHAITGTLHLKTMRIEDWIGSQNVLILIDSGSTHNFVDTSICKKAHFLIQNEQRIRVRVANGKLIG
jgi:hypothetical protein